MKTRSELVRCALAAADPPAARRLEVRAADGTRLSAVEMIPAGGQADAVILLPGFWRRAESPRIAELARTLSRRWRVLTLDFRGHGRSAGRFTFGRLEHLDVDALLAVAAERGVERAVLLGMSMGGASLLTALGRPGASPLPLDVRGAVVISAPSEFGAIRPRPWRRGSAELPWQDAVRVPRVEWAFPFTRKLAPSSCVPSIGGVPMRMLHGVGDWLVGHELGERLQACAPAGSELFLLDLPGGPHADDLLGRWGTLVHRLVLPFVAGCLDRPPSPDDGLELSVDPGPWLEALAEIPQEITRHSRDLGARPPSGEPHDVEATAAGRDGVHLAFRIGESACWARGVRDGSVHGLNLLANALAADGPGWAPLVRAALAERWWRLEAPGRGNEGTRIVRPRGEGGFEVRLP